MKRIAPAKEQRPDFLDLRDAFWILRRQVRLVLLTVGIGLGGALLYLAYATPLYTATALLFVDPSQKNILNPDDAYTLQGSAENARIESEVEILRSDTVMLAAIDAAGTGRIPGRGGRHALGRRTAVLDPGASDRPGRCAPAGHHLPDRGLGARPVARPGGDNRQRGGADLYRPADRHQGLGGIGDA